jgi:hypothetical protein
MSRLTLGLGLALLFALSLLASAPARLLSLVLPDERVVMQGFEGTLWHGSASRCLVRAGPGYLHLGRVEWRLRPLSLLTLAPRLSLQSQWGRQHVAGDIVLHGEGDFDLFQFEATVAADLVRQFAPVALGGTLNGSFERIAVRDGLPMAARGRLVWQNGAWEGPQGMLPLGTYALDITTEEPRLLSGEVLTLSGEVRAEGLAELAGRAYLVDILLTGENALDAQIERALSLIAASEGDRYRLRLEGEFQG